MMQKVESCFYGESDDWQAVELRLAYREYLSMFVVLPQKAGGLAKLEKELDAKVLNELFASMKVRRVDIELPKFKIASSANLKRAVAAFENTYPLVTYKVTKAGMIAFTQQLALQNAPYGIRANCILPGLMDTPMAVDTRARHSGKSRAEVAAARDARVPLRHKMGTPWDVANAALFLASDEANFITGVELPVDGGALVRIG